MSEPELLLDSNIRLWVVLPIVFITFFVGMIRHYVSILLQSDKRLTQEQVSDSQVLIRSRVLRENGKYIPKQSFLSRKYYFNNPEDGFFKKTKRKVVPPSPMTDPTMLTDMMKGNVTNVLPMILIGGWINMTFSGFVTTKVPFPLTLRFKPMLQQGIELLTLDASWVSSASWYFLNVFGLRSIYTLILGQDNAADQSRVMQEQMTGAAMAMPADTNKAFKQRFTHTEPAAWEVGMVCSHSVWCSVTFLVKQPHVTQPAAQGGKRVAAVCSSAGAATVLSQPVSAEVQCRPEPRALLAPVPPLPFWYWISRAVLLFSPVGT
ncbi:ER membrane protein complex subunit 3 isoform X1 [Chroicocephalus ridibundus]|uniref:ER membrane protein complex subunit 3 isoform X1 n=1 Tax=Chroicocephalus ridibundus TaxID=1192867 RepID=UPI002FDEAC63